VSTIKPFVIVAALAAIPVSAEAQHEAGRDIVETAVAAGSFKTLAAALEAGGLVDALRGDGPFTMFAPNDEAFAKLPEGTLASLLAPENKSKLVEILKFHVVPGRISAVDALEVGKGATLQGSELEFGLRKGQLFVSGRRVIENDIKATNGVIHVIDAVLIPEPKREPYKSLSPRGFLELAVAKGAPLFNAGNREACVAIYELAIRAVLDFDPALVSDETRSALQEALEKAEARRDAARKAWILRRGINIAWRELSRNPRATNDSEVALTSKQSDGEPVNLFTFDRDGDAWFSVNDNVMGGVSRGGFSVSPTGTAIFSGALSRENNGGFSTIRSPARDLGLEGFDGVLLTVRGDGRSYRFSALKTDRRWETRTWQTSFETEPGEWTEVRIPFEDLSLRIMGRWIRGAKGIRPADIRSFSIGIADKNEEPFRLEVAAIRAYRESK